MRRSIAFVCAALLCVGFAAACSPKRSADRIDRKTADRQLRRYQTNQPPPESPRSQLRQNLIEIEKSQIDTTQTTTFFFSRGASGSGSPVFDCPSIGYPIPSTYQLTNPLKPAGKDDNATIGQLESNGVYTGDSSGTYAICVSAEGKGYAVYWEGDVLTFSGPAAWNAEEHRAELVGEPSVRFSTGKG